MATTEPPAGRIISFTPEVKETLAQVFEGQPLYPRILELRFGQHAEMAEISEALQLPVGMVASSMQEALSKLLDQFSKQELQDLLARD
jgi:DNA-directed RNA polymerase specialized sigma24 family protein